jgi:hypothetical protein
VAWQTFSHEGLTIDAQFGDPCSLVVVGDVDGSTCGTLLDALAAAMTWPGLPAIEVNIVLARFADERCRDALFAAQDSAVGHGRRFTIG